MDYFASPQRASPYLPPLIIGVDFNKCEANMVGTGDEPFYKWTEQMGMVGSRTTWNQLIKLGEKIRGKNFGVKRFMQQIFVAMAQGEIDFEATLNTKFPEIQPMTINAFLAKWWGSNKGQLP
ncbi:unnamed protein product [Rotaria socialis]|uniref:Uncharacterized protein n=1 Tax=Rotaria socialis TaxID=392032 RepID=A0A817RVP6_9BILA|nr:unnamed protein product [Rotaria socialis]CAF3688704.1 unnamed protein product [Rotaria socialis]